MIRQQSGVEPLVMACSKAHARTRTKRGKHTKHTKHKLRKQDRPSGSGARRRRDTGGGAVDELAGSLAAPEVTAAAEEGLGAGGAEAGSPARDAEAEPRAVVAPMELVSALCSCSTYGLSSNMMALITSNCWSLLQGGDGGGGLPGGCEADGFWPGAGAVTVLPCLPVDQVTSDSSAGLLEVGRHPMVTRPCLQPPSSACSPPCLATEPRAVPCAYSCNLPAGKSPCCSCKLTPS